MIFFLSVEFVVSTTNMQNVKNRVQLKVSKKALFMNTNYVQLGINLPLVLKKIGIFLSWTT